MTFDPTIGWAVVVTVALAAVGAVGWLFTLHTGHGVLKEDFRELRVRVDTIDREGVKEKDFQRFEDRIEARFVKIEHAVNGGALKTAELVKDMIRGMLAKERP